MATLAELLAEQERCRNRLSIANEVDRYLAIQDEINKMAATPVDPPP